ncbi:MAG: tetratricopeptide repeat protein, partial [Candidatus Aminicenantales bacterium]
MKTKLFVSAALAVILAFALSGAVQQSAEQLYKSGLYEEEVGGDLQKAIGIYQDILRRFPDNREIAAKTLYHLGSCYEKLGLKQAQETFQKIVDNYPEQTDVFGKAKEKLTALLMARNIVGRGSKEFRIRNIGPLDVLGAPSPDGRLISCVDWDTGDLAIMDVDSGKKRR